MAARAAIAKRHHDFIHHNNSHRPATVEEPIAMTQEIAQTQSNELFRAQHEVLIEGVTSSAFNPGTHSTPKKLFQPNPTCSFFNGGADAATASSSAYEVGQDAGSLLPPVLQVPAQIPNEIVNLIVPVPQFRAPILGYEVVEHHDKFTAFKINVQQLSTHQSWFVFRRYTDFVRLHKKLTGLFTQVRLLLPSKRWFKDNFDPSFLEQRILGLQRFINIIFDSETMSKNVHVIDFFCLDDPPSTNDNLQASRLHCECMETMISSLSLKLKEKNLENEILKAELALAKAQKDSLVRSLRKEKLRGHADNNNSGQLPNVEDNILKQNQSPPANLNDKPSSNDSRWERLNLLPAFENDNAVPATSIQDNNLCTGNSPDLNMIVVPLD